MARTEMRLRPTVLRACRSAALAALLSGAAAQAAEAQIGGLLKKAKKQMENTVAPAPGEQPVRFDGVTLELTEGRVTQVLSALQAGRRVLEGGEGGPGLAALTAERDQAQERRVRLHEENAAALERQQRAFVRARDCRSDAFEAMEREQMSRYTARVASDPALQQALAALGQELGMATAAGDTLAVRRVHRRMMEAAKLAISAADSATVDARCGRLPAELPVQAEIEALAERERNASRAIRALEQRAAAAELDAAGDLTERQLGMARERVALFLAAPADRPARGFSPAEREALGARRHDLQRYF